MASPYWSACVSEYTDCYNSNVAIQFSTCVDSAFTVATESSFDIISAVTASMPISALPGYDCVCHSMKENWSCASKWCAAGTGTVIPAGLLIATDSPTCGGTSSSSGFSQSSGASEPRTTPVITPAATGTTTAALSASATAKTSSGSSRSTLGSGYSLVVVRWPLLVWE